MAKLSVERKKIPKSEISQQNKKGNLSKPSEKMDNKVNKIVGHRTLRGVRK